MKRIVSRENGTLEVWHYEHPDHPVAYCREIGKWWTGGSVIPDGRGQSITANPKFVTCTSCLKKMKANGIKSIFTPKEMEILKKVYRENHIPYPEDEETAIACRSLASSGHIARIIGFKNEVLFYETVTGNNAVNVILEVYGDEYK